MIKNFHKDARKKQFQYASDMRKAPTDAEDILWQRLRNRKILGFKFRRQHPLNKFIVDFYCHEANLIIEVDGEIHETPEQKDYDLGRTYELNAMGFNVVRFSNAQVKNSIKDVLEEIKRLLSQL